MPIGTILSDIFSSGASKVVDSIGNAFKKNFTTDEERLQAANACTAEVNRHLEGMQQQMNDADQKESEELTKRLQIDMTSDSKLSKNIRPMMLIFSSIVVTILCVMDSCNIGGHYSVDLKQYIKDFSIAAEWIELFKAAWMVQLVFYFGGRTVEKWKSIDSK